MKKVAKIILLLVMSVSFVLLCGCREENSGSFAVSGYRDRFICSGDNNVEIIKDKETGVLYMAVSGGLYGPTGVTVLVDSDGKPIVDQEGMGKNDSNERSIIDQEGLEENK